MIDQSYAGPLEVRPVALSGATSSITLTDLPPTELANITAKEAQHSVAVVSAVHTADGALELQAATGRPSWRAWFGDLSTSGPGCFALRAESASFSEVIAFYVHGGAPPPG